MQHHAFIVVWLIAADTRSGDGGDGADSAGAAQPERRATRVLDTSLFLSKVITQKSGYRTPGVLFPSLRRRGGRDIKKTSLSHL